MVGWQRWAALLVALLAVLAVDLRGHRGARDPSLREAVAWTLVWAASAAALACLLWVWRGGAVAGEFLAGYLVELSLSVDNVFVFVLILTHFAVPPADQHRVLFWGVLGAIAMRLGFVLAGGALIERFEWIALAFGALLLVTAVRFLRPEREAASVADASIVRLVRRVVPVTDGYRGPHFVVREAGRRVATPLLAVLIVIELTDIAFALDSIPAIFAVTRETFIVFAASAFAMLGLRSLYFVVVGAMHGLRYLRVALAAILAFAGLKMLLAEVVHVPVGLSLAVIVAILSICIVASLAVRHREPAARAQEGVADR